MSGGRGFQPNTPTTQGRRQKWAQGVAVGGMSREANAGKNTRDKGGNKGGTGVRGLQDVSVDRLQKGPWPFLLIR